jgi:hypothetical protein
VKHKRTLNRKRIRGLRRLFRQHQRWAAVPEELSLSLFERAHSQREQLGIAPWTVHGKPPLAIRQLWANRLLTDFFEWQRQLTPVYLKFYLSIRLYDPRFGLSQLDAATHEQQAYFERRFGDEGEDVPLPFEYQSLPGAAQLRWTCYAEVDVYGVDEFAEYYAWYKRKPYWSAQNSNGEDCVVVQTGYVWVGRVAT